MNWFCQEITQTDRARGPLSGPRPLRAFQQPIGFRARPARCAQRPLPPAGTPSTASGFAAREVRVEPPGAGPTPLVRNMLAQELRRARDGGRRLRAEALHALEAVDHVRPDLEHDGGAVAARALRD